MCESKGRQILLPILSETVAEFSLELRREFEKRGFSTRIIPKDEFVLLPSGFQEDSEFVMGKYLSHAPKKDIHTLLEKYEIASPRSFVFPQVVYEHKDVGPHSTGIWSNEGHVYSPYVSLLHRSLDFFDQLYGEGQGGHVVQYQGGEILHRVLHRVALHHGYESVWVGFSPVEGDFSIFENESVEWDSFSDTELNLSPADADRARDFLHEFRDSRAAIGASGEESPNLSLISRTISVTQRRLRRLIEFQGGKKALIRRFISRRTRQIQTNLRAKYTVWRGLDESESHSLITDSKYIFYPLQYFRESRVTVRAQPFYDQAWLIEYLSRSLPADHELVVKPHPQQLGSLPRQAIKAIAQYAELIHPDVNSHDIIENSAAVVTLNNTVGYESLLYGKPVITLGDAFYDGAGYTHDVKNLSHLAERINEAIQSGGLSDEEILEVAHRVLSGSHKGIWSDPTEDNVERIAESLTEYLSQRLTESNNQLSGPQSR
ncbi:hypothetical protein EGO51_11350 [Haloarcula hispanica]|uniref:Capsule polysaccharide biosynthesis protein n=1 Tax=Haloarcula hispanica TaxID=51589 RepID=A0A5J5LLR9_HALHI|nr:hypothetical protein [Haloarcula hispanica]KAA9410372.1 hypothetical protein EGO51_11350 [Haloarcula hispanica]